MESAGADMKGRWAETLGTVHARTLLRTWSCY